jgi:rubrerythrin
VEDLESALAVIQAAIHNEVSGQRFYNEAAQYCIDPWAKEMFATLAEEEDAHTRLLLLEFEALTTRGHWIDPELALASDAVVDITHFVFPDADSTEGLFSNDLSAGHVIDRRSDDLAALTFGIDMEAQAIDLYERGAKTATDLSARRMYEWLVGEETQHYQLLRDRWEELAGLPFEET